MSPESCAQMLGRSLKWVRARIEALEAETVDAAEAPSTDEAGSPAVAPDPEPAPEPAPEPLSPPTVVCRDTGRDPTGVVVDIARPTRGERRSPPATGPRPVGGGVSAAARIERLKPVRQSVVRYAGWFLDARWPLAEVAGLFDVDAGQLLAAIEAAA